MASSFGRRSSDRRRPKKSVADRTPEETASLIRDVLAAAVEAGPRAGPARTLQAYVALTRTVQDFLPAVGGEEFSAPVALRKLFERLGARYPALAPHLEEGIAVAIDGEIFQDALFATIGPDSEVHVIPKIAGG